MNILQSCVDTLVTIASIDDEAVISLGFAALAAYEAAETSDPQTQAKRLKILSLEFAERSNTSFTALLFQTEIASRARAASKQSAH